jgi:hypothetical protein
MEELQPIVLANLEVFGRAVGKYLRLEIATDPIRDEVGNRTVL